MSTLNKLIDYFLRHENKIVYAKDLRELFHLSPQVLRAYIAKLREQGYWIIANSKGYKLTNDRKELMEYANKRELEIYFEQKIIKAMKESMKWTKNKS